MLVSDANKLWRRCLSVGVCELLKLWGVFNGAAVWYGLECHGQCRVVVVLFVSRCVLRAWMF